MSSNRDATQPFPHPPRPPKESFSIDPSGRERRRINVTTISQPTTAPEPQPAAMGPPLTDVHTANNQNIPGEWDYLLDRYRNDDDDEAMDLYGDQDTIMDEEDGYDSDEEEEPMDAMDIEGGTFQGKGPRGGKLSEAEVIAVIDDCIAQLTEAWYPGKVNAQDQPVNVHELLAKAESNGRREQLAKKSRMNVEYFGDRLNRMGDEILRSTWNHEKDVRRICSSLEATVESLEYERWLLNLYEPDGKDPENHVVPEIIDLGSAPDSSDTEGELGDAELVSATDRLSVGVHSLKTPSRPAQPPHSRPAPSPQSPPTPPPPSQRLPKFQKLQIDQPAPVRAQLHSRESPELASISTVAKWTWTDLVNTMDRKRIVMKIIQEMNGDDRETLRTRITTVRKQNLLMEMPHCVAMLLRGDKKIQGVLPRDLPKIVSFTRLFLSWWLADNYFRQEAEEWRLEELAQCLEEKSPDPEVFYNWVREIFEKTFSKEALTKPTAPSQSEIIVISDSDDEAPKLTPAPRKKRAQGSQLVKDAVVTIED